MNIGYHKWHSPHLDRDMELKVYGNAGNLLSFSPPRPEGFSRAEDEGIMESVSGFINDGRIHMIAVDSIDHESWSNREAHPHQRGLRHNQYENLHIKWSYSIHPESFGNGKYEISCTGFSMGAYHAANFFFKHPDQFDTVIAISGFYNLKMLVRWWSWWPRLFQLT